MDTESDYKHTKAVLNKQKRYTKYYWGQLVYVVLDDSTDTYARMLHNTDVMEDRLHAGTMSFEQAIRIYNPRPCIHKLLINLDLDDDDYEEKYAAILRPEMNRRIEKFENTGQL